MNHLQACPECPKYSEDFLAGGCTIYDDVSWVNRRGGCGMFPSRELLPGMSYLDGKITRKGRSGQQKQKHEDRKYHSKNDRKTKFRRVTEVH